MARTARERIHGDPVSQRLFDEVVGYAASLGPVDVQEKATSFHVAHGRAFLGIHPRRGGIVVNVVLEYRLEDPRVLRAEQVSARRWHNEVLLTDPDQLDDLLRAWIGEAFALTITA